MKRIIRMAAYCMMSCVFIACGKSKDYHEAVKDNDFETAHKILDELYEDFLDTWESNIDEVGSENLLKTGVPSRTKILSKATKYSQAASYVLCAEARYIISNNPDEANERIAYLFNEIRVMGDKVNDYYPAGIASYKLDCAKHDCYVQTVKYNNELCDVVLNLAIQHHNKELAEIVMSYYRENGRATDGPIHWTNEAQEAAEAKFEKAKEDGKFD